ncbi:uncharacterized protein EV420DRAFT_1747189 [Desarmillaria tabescens]|uniref:Uncharacterized protein n=1 Tax=Armillaria tabescens TaxID=1929756 RepID=A0AA39N714_ARMTA|nr:uncharacterized protein EV420DRAFT_1747189 [Desarmillaria tabescens]KAK0460277.1 hypothetical protein EV420DRAFT_1747189 [Desarmillaria tabescens]
MLDIFDKISARDGDCGCSVGENCFSEPITNIGDYQPSVRGLKRSQSKISVECLPSPHQYDIIGKEKSCSKDQHASQPMEQANPLVKHTLARTREFTNIFKFSRTWAWRSVTETTWKTNTAPKKGNGDQGDNESPMGAVYSKRWIWIQRTFKYEEVPEYCSGTISVLVKIIRIRQVAVAFIERLAIYPRCLPLCSDTEFLVILYLYGERNPHIQIFGNWVNLIQESSRLSRTKDAV